MVGQYVYHRYGFTPMHTGLPKANAQNRHGLTSAMLYWLEQVMATVASAWKGNRHGRQTKRPGTSRVTTGEDHIDPCRRVGGSRGDILDVPLRVPCTFPALNKQQPNKRGCIPVGK